MKQHRECFPCLEIISSLELPEISDKLVTANFNLRTNPVQWLFIFAMKINWHKYLPSDHNKYMRSSATVC